MASRVQIVIEAIDRSSAAIRKVANSVNRMNRNLENQQLRLNRRFAQGTANSWKLTAGFLGVMFAGMALNNALRGLLGPALEAVGVFEVWNDLLTIFFLPAALLLLDTVLGLMDVFLGLPEPVQTMIGIFLLLGIAISGLTMFLGQLGLALIGLSMLAPVIGGVVSAVSGVASGVLAAIAGLPVGVALIIAAALLALIVNWEATWKAISTFFVDTWNSFQKVIDGVIDIITGIIKLFFDVFKGDWSAVWDDLSQIVKGVLKVIEGLFIDPFRNILNLALGLVASIIGGLDKIITWLVDTLAPGLKKPWNDLKDFIKGIVDWVTEQWNNVAKAIDDAISKLKFWENKGPAATNTGGKWLPWFQHGGVMPYSGIAHLEAGERVLTRDESQNYFNNSQSIVINASVSGQGDIQSLANELERRWYGNLNRSVMR